MPRIYEITYLPWVDNDMGKPWLYSGSDYLDNDSYFGSPSSTKVCEWTKGLTIRDWWKKELKDNPQNFIKNTLIECSDNISRVELQALESAIQTSEDHRNNSKYFNRTNKHYKHDHSINVLKGLSYEEIYGYDEAKEQKEKRANSLKSSRKTERKTLSELEFKEKYTKKNTESFLKNKTYIEVFGKEAATKINKQKGSSISKTKNDPNWKNNVGKTAANKTKEKNKELENRPLVLKIKELQKKLKVKIGSGWSRKPDEFLEEKYQELLQYDEL